jgi:hypothetical protein
MFQILSSLHTPLPLTQLFLVCKYHYKRDERTQHGNFQSRKFYVTFTVKKIRNVSEQPPPPSFQHFCLLLSVSLLELQRIKPTMVN